MAPVRPLIVVLASAVAFVLLIACVNVTNLLLNRNAARRQELALRVALGASPGRVVRYVLTETLLVATLGGAAGVLLALGTVSAVAHARHQSRPPGPDARRQHPSARRDSDRWDRAHIHRRDHPLCRPARRTSADCSVCARDGTWTRSEIGLSSIASVHAGPSRGGRAALLVTQTALATMALIGGGLLVHSFVKLANVDPGYEAAHLLTFTVRSSASAGSVPFSEEVAERLRGLPGVKAAGYAELLPMVRFRTGGPLAPAQPMPAGTPPPPAPIDMRTVSHEFVTAMGMRIVAGRTLRQDDERAVLMNETLARSGFLGPQRVGPTGLGRRASRSVRGGGYRAGRAAVRARSGSRPAGVRRRAAIAARQSHAVLCGACRWRSHRLRVQCA